MRRLFMGHALEVEALAQTVNIPTDDLREALSAYVEATHSRLQGSLGDA